MASVRPAATAAERQSLVKALEAEGTQYLAKAVLQRRVVGDGGALLSDGDADHTTADAPLLHWHTICDACVDQGSMAPVVQLVVARSEDGPTTGHFLIQQVKPIHDWVVSTSRSCVESATVLETALADMAATPSAASRSLRHNYAALDVRVGHVFAVLRALLVRLRWQVVLDADRHLTAEASLAVDGGSTVVTSVAMDASRDRIRSLLNDAMRVSNDSLITTSVDAVVESWPCLSRLRTTLLARLEAVDREVVAIRSERVRAREVYDQRVSLLDAMSQLTSRDGSAAEANAERLRQLKADYDAYTTALNQRHVDDAATADASEQRHDILTVLRHSTEQELHLLSWLLALHHLRQRVACGRWLLETLTTSATPTDTTSFQDMMEAVQTALTTDAPSHAADSAPSPPPSSFWAQLWERLSAHLTAAGVVPSLPSTATSLPPLLYVGSQPIDVAAEHGDARPSAPLPHDVMTDRLQTAFAAHDAGAVVVLYWALFNVLRGATAGAGLTDAELRSVKYQTNMAVVSFAQTLSALPTAQAVLVLVLLDAAVVPAAARDAAWLVEWALELFRDPAIAWTLRRDEDGAPAAILGVATGAIGHRLLALGFSHAAVDSHRSLWPLNADLSPANGLMMVKALLACGRWIDAFAVARGVADEDNALLKECFQWFADGKWQHLLALPLDDRESAVLDQQLAVLHETHPTLRANELRIVFRMSRLKSLDGVSTNLSKRRVADPSASATALQGIVKHYTAKCALPPSVAPRVPSGAPTSGGVPGDVALSAAVSPTLSAALRRWQLHTHTHTSAEDTDVAVDGVDDAAGATGAGVSAGVAAGGLEDDARSDASSDFGKFMDD